jgi:hypothetical protein
MTSDATLALLAASAAVLSVYAHLLWLALGARCREGNCPKCWRGVWRA